MDFFMNLYEKGRLKVRAALNSISHWRINTVKLYEVITGWVCKECIGMNMTAT